MELPRSEESAVYSSDISVVHNFDIDPANKGLIFKILRSKMYSDPIGSICREISSNCRDAHREVKKPNTPIEIELIQEFWGTEQPHIIFRDYGPGLSPDRVANIYTKYGSSTKRGSNVQTGGFGLGGKTPFSYTDSFCVVTVVDKIKYTYNLVIEETEEGRMVLLGQDECNEPNRTEVIIPISSKKDIEEFHSKSISVTKFWTPRPIFKGFESSSEYDYQVIEDTPEYMIIREPGSRYNRKTPILGCLIDSIYYPVQSNDKWYLRELDQPYCVLLKFGNGVLSVSSNRETLNYDKQTTDQVTRVFKKIKDSVTKKISEIFAGYTELEKSFMSTLLDRDSIPVSLGSESATIVKYRLFDMYNTIKLPTLFSRNLRYMGGYEVRIADSETLEVRVRKVELHALALQYIKTKFPIYWTSKTTPPTSESRTALLQIPGLLTIGQDGNPTVTSSLNSIYVFTSPSVVGTSNQDLKDRIEKDLKIIKDQDISCIDDLEPTAMKRRKSKPNSDKAQSYILYSSRVRSYGKTIHVKRIDKKQVFSLDNLNFYPIEDLIKDPDILFFPLSSEDRLSPDPKTISYLQNYGIQMSKTIYFVPASTQQALKIEYSKPEEAFKNLDLSSLLTKLPTYVLNAFLEGELKDKYEISQYNIEDFLKRMNHIFKIDPKIIKKYDRFIREKDIKHHLQKIDEIVGSTVLIDAYNKVYADYKLNDIANTFKKLSQGLGVYLWKLIASDDRDKNLLTQIEIYYKGLNLI